MAIEIILLIFGIFLGIAITYWFLSKQKWGDKAEAINERWKRQITELEKQYELKLEKSQSFMEKIKEENKTHLEKLSSEWQVKYIRDIEDLKKLFKESEKVIKAKSVSSSRRSLVGKFIERFIPFLKRSPYEPSDMHFLGQPVDYIVFEGLHEDNVKKVVFLEVKTGESKLTKREKSLREAIEKKRVYWKELRIDTPDENLPDEEMEDKETQIKELYNNIENKISLVKLNKISHQKKEDDVNEDEEYNATCPKCRKEFTLQLEGEDDLESGVQVPCPHCNKTIILTEENTN